MILLYHFFIISLCIVFFPLSHSVASHLHIRLFVRPRLFTCVHVLMHGNLQGLQIGVEFGSPGFPSGLSLASYVLEAYIFINLTHV